MNLSHKKSGSIYADVTETFLKQLKSATLPWVRRSEFTNLNGPISLPLGFDGEPYRGIDILLLWTRTVKQSHDSPFWMTAEKAAELGGRVLEGVEGSPLLSVETLNNKLGCTASEEEDGETVRIEGRGDILQQPVVFNVQQIEGLPARFDEPEFSEAFEPDQLQQVLTFCWALGADIRENSSRAYYDIDHDIVRMPDSDILNDERCYVNLLVRQCVHWTRHPSRLDRSFGRKGGDHEADAMEELVAEIGAAFLLAHFGLRVELAGHHVSCLVPWIEMLRSDPRAIFLAADHAQKAFDFLRARQSEGEAHRSGTLPCNYSLLYAPPVSMKVLAASAVLHEVCTPLSCRAAHDLLSDTLVSIVAKVIATAPDAEAQTAAGWFDRVLENPAIGSPTGMMNNLPVESASVPASEPLVRTLLFMTDPESAIVAILRMLPERPRHHMLTRAVRIFFGLSVT